MTSQKSATAKHRGSTSSLNSHRSQFDESTSSTRAHTPDTNLPSQRSAFVNSKSALSTARSQLHSSHSVMSTFSHLSGNTLGGTSSTSRAPNSIMCGGGGGAQSSYGSQINQQQQSTFSRTSTQSNGSRDSRPRTMTAGERRRLEMRERKRDQLMAMWKQYEQQVLDEEVSEFLRCTVQEL